MAKAVPNANCRSLLSLAGQYIPYRIKNLPDGVKLDHKWLKISPTRHRSSPDPLGPAKVDRAFCFIFLEIVGATITGPKSSCC